MSRPASKRGNYNINTVEEAKSIAKMYLSEHGYSSNILFGLPEIDDRYNIWRVPLKTEGGSKVGEVVIDAISTLIDESKTTKADVVNGRILNIPKQRRKQISVACMRFQAFGIL